MSTFIMVTRLESDAARSPRAFEQLEKSTMAVVRSQCPDVEWLSSYAALGPYDYVDIFRATDIDTATKVSALVRACGHAHAEIWPATEWSHFKELMRSMPAAV